MRAPCSQLISRLAIAKRFYAAQLGHAGADRAGIDEMDMEGDENVSRPDFACPYCYEDHDIASLVTNLEEDHPFEPHAAICTRGANLDQLHLELGPV
ncbi:hypothetical protein TRIUR3_30781 [Triticum urartu]|uniref:Di19 zinc-binding domain-containing protein n=1 Tax=Triticum urartu TaxID=4572 RepID=M7ZZC7_TRIUA|nr:hypothetical protein TRIUR3_30781 [Triticum urartu]